MRFVLSAIVWEWNFRKTRALVHAQEPEVLIRSRIGLKSSYTKSRSLGSGQSRALESYQITSTHPAKRSTFSLVCGDSSWLAFPRSEVTITKVIAYTWSVSNLASETFDLIACSDVRQSHFKCNMQRENRTSETSRTFCAAATAVETQGIGMH